MFSFAGCYPFYKEGPFIINDCPHVLFAGNMTKFDSKVFKGKKPNSQMSVVCAFVSYHNKLHVCDIISKYNFYWLKKKQCIISLVSVFPILSKNFWMTGIEFNTRGLCWHQYNSNISECYTCSTMNLTIFFMIIKE